MKLASEIDGPIAVIGDVHGQVDKLGVILDRLQDVPQFEDRWIVFAGDFVDRGPDTRATIDMFHEFYHFHPRTTAVAGNHDFAMAASLGLIPAPEYSNWAERWLDHYSAEATFASYNVPFADLGALRDALPEAHQAFLANLPWLVEHPRYLVVHAGLDPYSPFETQMKILRQRDFSLNRPQWLCEKSYAEGPLPPGCMQTVISGHVCVPKVIIRKQRILCDTSGGLEGDLSCVLLPEMEVITSGNYQHQPSDYSKQGIPPESNHRSKAWWKFW